MLHAISLLALRNHNYFYSQLLCVTPLGRYCGKFKSEESAEMRVGDGSGGYWGMGHGYV